MKRRNTSEIDSEFEKMTASLFKNFNSMGSLMSFLRASLPQTMIRKFVSVGKDKDGWKKSNDHLTTLMDQEDMITLEDTETVIKQCEQLLQRVDTDVYVSPKSKVLAHDVTAWRTSRVCGSAREYRGNRQRGVEKSPAPELVDVGHEI
jgi:hypothetical protein